MKPILEINNKTTLDDLDIILNEVTIGRDLVQYGISAQKPKFTKIARDWLDKNNIRIPKFDSQVDLSNATERLNIGDLIFDAHNPQKIKSILLELIADDKKDDEKYIKIFVNKIIAILALLREINFKMIFLYFDHLEKPPVTALGSLDDAISFKVTPEFL